jgi:hypothetical protein
VTTAFAKQLPCSFARIRFPYSDIEFQGGLRDHVHEYSHSDGGDPEKLGRKLNVIRITALFHDTFRKYPGLYPNALDTLLRYWEQGRTEELVVPQRGTFKAYAYGWTTRASAKVLSGETVTIEFREDNDGENALIELVNDRPLDVRTPALKLDARVKEAGVQGDSLSAAQEDTALPGGDRDLFDSLQDLANSVFAIQDTAALNGQLYGAKLSQLAAICQRADGLRSMQSTSSQPIVQALHELWAAAIRLGDDAQGKQRALQRYTTPQRMTMGDVAIAIYRDASRTSELLALNSGNYQEATAIPAGTDIVYSPPS